MKLTPEQIKASPHNLVGPESEIEEKITKWAARGLTYWMIPHGAIEAIAPIVKRLTGKTFS